jgi:hypothetical protein
LETVFQCLETRPRDHTFTSGHSQQWSHNWINKCYSQTLSCWITKTIHFVGLQKHTSSRAKRRRVQGIFKLCPCHTNMIDIYARYFQVGRMFWCWQNWSNLLIPYPSILPSLNVQVAIFPTKLNQVRRAVPLILYLRIVYSPTHETYILYLFLFNIVSVLCKTFIFFRIN